METEKGVMIVAYKQSRRSNRYALLKRKKNWEGWELPKGHLEEDDYRKTVKIELMEECGIDESQIQSMEDLKEATSWKYEQDGTEFRKEYKAFAVKVDEDVRIDTSQNPCDEHEQGFFLKKEDAESLLTYENNRELLQRAAEKIQEEE
ncbi:MAG: NUDIX domain-containing protein [Candidatus Nanohalobium sp.]